MSTIWIFVENKKSYVIWLEKRDIEKYCNLFKKLCAFSSLIAKNMF